MSLDQQKALLYEAILRATPGKTASQKMAFLKNQGFDLSAGPQAQYVGATAPTLVNPVGEMYQHNQGLSSVFSLMDKQGLDPISAVEKARKDGVLPAVPGQFDPVTGDKIDYTRIAQDYARANLDNKQKLAAFNQQEAAKRAQWEAKQKPNLMNELGHQSVYQDLASGFGKDFTAQDLMNQYAQSHAYGGQASDMLRNAAYGAIQSAAHAMVPGSNFQPAAQAAQVAANPYGSDLLKKYMEQQAQQQLNPLISKAKSTAQYNPKVQELVNTLATIHASGV